MSRALGAVTALWLAVLTIYVVVRYYSFYTSVFDLGIHDQMTWLLSRGRLPLLSTRGLDAMADHFSAVAYLLAPLYWVWASPVLLLLVQTGLLASGAVPVYRLARQTQSERVSLALAVAYLAQPSLLFILRFDVHFNVFTLPLCLWALWFLEAGRPGLYAASLALALTTGEFVGFSVLLLGWNAWRLRGPRWGLATAALGGAGLVVARASMNLHNHGEPSQYLTLYARWGDSAGGIVQGLLTHPWQAAVTLLDPLYWALLLLPLGGLPLLAPGRLVPMLPIVAGNLLSWRAPQHGLEYQYMAGILPFLLWAAVGGARRLPAPTPVLLTLAVGLTIGWSLGPFAPWAPLEVRSAGELRAALRLIGPDEAVCAENSPGCHLSEREQLYRFPTPFQPTAWGNRAQALAEQSGHGFEPLLPGAFRRSAEATRFPWLVLCPPWSQAPLDAPDRWHLAHALVDTRLFEVARQGRDFILLHRGGAQPAPEPGTWPSYRFEQRPRRSVTPRRSPSRRQAHRFARGQEQSVQLGPLLSGAGEGRDTSRPLVYGPYLPVPPGRYRVSFLLVGKAARGVAEVCAEGGDRSLWEESFQLRKRAEVSGTFTLARERVLETRLHLRGGALRVAGVELRREQADPLELEAQAILEAARAEYQERATEFESGALGELSLTAGLKGQGLTPLVRGGKLGWRVTVAGERSVWGPYLRVPAGEYEVEFRLAELPPAGAEVIADVASEGGSRTLWTEQQTLLGTAGIIRGRFRAPAGTLLETRVLTRAPLVLEGVSLRRI